MFFDLTNAVMDRSALLRRGLNRAFYQLTAYLDKEGRVRLMNYGYVPPDGPPLPLKPEDEDDRVYLQMYHRVATSVGVEGRDVLEVGSGRGGGASYICRCLKPRTMTGVDYARKAVAFCQSRYPIERLRFLYGDAENLPFEAESFDVVINIESSHCYGSMASFFEEVHRVLRPGGHFAWTDYRPPAEVEPLLELLRQSGFAILSREDITGNVFESVKSISDGNKKLIDEHAPRFIRPLMYQFAAVKGSTFYRHFEERTMEYVLLATEKVVAPDGPAPTASS